MDERLVILFVKKFQKYRRYQRDLVKRREMKAGGKENVMKVTALMVNIKAIQEEMDEIAVALLGRAKKVTGKKLAGAISDMSKVKKELLN